MIFQRAFFFLVASTVAGGTMASAPAQPPGTDAIAAAPVPVKARPRVGLVLSGGGARGAAHVGVIKVLEELRVPIDYIAGSSMGALIGAAYASGTSSRELEDRLMSQDWDRLLTDESPRSDRSFLRKEEDQSRLFRLELGVKEGSVRLPPGAISGQKFDILFSQITRNTSPALVFDELPIPFRAVATDAESGQMTVFDQGRLTDAMRASMSVPGAIAPYQIGDHIYLDGGLTRNLPVDVARQMGADVVIVVNIGTPLLKRQDIQSLVGVSLQMVNILTEQNVRASIESLKNTDFLISPPLDTIGATDFSLSGDAITIGAAATREKAQALRVLSLPPDEYAALRGQQLARAQRPIGDKERIDEINVTGLERASAEELKRTLGMKVGDPLDFKKLNSGVSRVFGSGYFERVNYSLLNDGYRNLLNVDAREKQWGPNYLRLGLSLAADTQGEGRFNLLVRYLMTQFNSAGAEWRNDVQLGRDRRFASQFVQPFSATGLLNAISISPGVEFVKRPVDTYENGIRTAQSLQSTNTSSLDLGFDLTRSAVMRLGVVQANNTANVNIGRQIFAETRYKSGGARFRFLYDSLDDPNFPREGRLFQLDYYASLESLKATNVYRKGEVNYLDNYSFGNHTVSLATRYGQIYRGGALTLDQFTLGGFLQMSGYRSAELVSNSVLYGRLGYIKRVPLLNNPFGKNAYFGLAVEGARTAINDRLLWKADTLNSYAAYMGFDSVFGPIYLGYGRAKERTPVFYVFLGQP